VNEMNAQYCDVAGSFRDTTGFLFFSDGVLYRQINQSYRKDYELLIQSGLYARLTSCGFLIAHAEADKGISRQHDIAFKVIQPEYVPFISYPYEWCFSQLKDAALLTLAIQKKALQANMSLKDCSAYNVQYLHGRPVFIDTLSFEHYNEGSPWVAYRQFCQHFLAPLALMAYRDTRLNQLAKIFIDGIPLDLASGMLPLRTNFRLGLLMHLHLHARMQRRFSQKKSRLQHKTFSRNSFFALIDNLQDAVGKLQWLPHGTEWAEYYSDTNYSETAFKHKQNLVRDFIAQASPKTVWDLGANVGVFSRIPAGMGIPTIAFDVDPAAVEKFYCDCRKNNENNLLPLLMDMTNPSPDLGWAHTERIRLAGRGPADTLMALALVHHLAIGNNVPLHNIAKFFSSLCEHLIIEFVPKEDSQVKRLLLSRTDIFTSYSREAFENVFRRFFNLVRIENIDDSLRTLYLMKKIRGA
jgi:hypothetical protein